MSDDVTIEQAVSDAIGECAGYVSLCWDPRPTGVFDSALAAAAVQNAVGRVVQAIKREALEECKKRGLGEGYSVGYSAAMEDGWGQPKNRKAVMAAALDAARAAIEAIPDGYKIRGEFETYSAYHEGRSDFKDGALAAIDALREKA